MAWHQLTYASSEGAGGGPGGWQVQGQLPADMPDSVREQLRARVVTRFIEVTPTDEFANSVELAARPRRLFFEPLREGLAWWHAASAGKDATGRPGNVFTHGVLLTGPAGALRPIDLWRSPDWLAPFGAAEVRAARLGDFGRPGPLDRGVVSAWVHDHPDQLEPLLAAVSWMLAERGRHVVLVTSTVDDFAAWVSAATHLTAPAIARQIPFVNFERVGDGANELPASGFVGVPLADAADVRELQHEGTLVLSLDDLPVEPVDGSWQYDGQSWPVDPIWQDALYGASGLEPDQLAKVLDTLDEITAPIGENEQVAPGWPLALALLKVAPQRVQNRADLLAQWQATRPWGGLQDRHLLGILRPGAAAPAPPPVVPSLPEEWSVLLDAAQRLLRYAEGATYVEREAVRRCVHVLLAQGLPKHADPEARRRAEGFLALGDRLPDEVRELLLSWSPAPTGRTSHG